MISLLPQTKMHLWQNVNGVKVEPSLNDNSEKTNWFIIINTFQYVQCNILGTNQYKTPIKTLTQELTHQL